MTVTHCSYSMLCPWLSLPDFVALPLPSLPGSFLMSIASHSSHPQISILISRPSPSPHLPFGPSHSPSSFLPGPSHFPSSFLLPCFGWSDPGCHMEPSPQPPLLLTDRLLVLCPWPVRLPPLAPYCQSCKDKGFLCLLPFPSHGAGPRI